VKASVEGAFAADSLPEGALATFDIGGCGTCCASGGGAAGGIWPVLAGSRVRLWTASFSGAGKNKYTSAASATAAIALPTISLPLEKLTFCSDTR